MTQVYIEKKEFNPCAMQYDGNNADEIIKFSKGYVYWGSSFFSSKTSTLCCRRGAPGCMHTYVLQKGDWVVRETPYYEYVMSDAIFLERFATLKKKGDSK
jgi:hypothetical protein